MRHSFPPLEAFTILFEIITFYIRKQINRVTVIVKILENFRGEFIPVTAFC